MSEWAKSSLWRMQVISNMLDFGMEPQMALDAPRFSVFGVDSAEGPCTVRESRWAQPAQRERQPC